MVQYKVDLDEVRDLFIKKIPSIIVDKIYIWAMKVEFDGLIKTRKILGFHDEPLKGKRLGQRSVRLNRSYRLFYEEIPDQKIIIVKVIEVNKHEY